MDRPKLVAVITGAISLLLGIVYLLMVQFLDFRGEMVPAPQSQSPTTVDLASILRHTSIPSLPEDIAILAGYHLP